MLKFVSIIFISEIPDPVIEQEDIIGSCVKDDEAEKTIGMFHLFHSIVLHFLFSMIELFFKYERSKNLSHYTM